MNILNNPAFKRWFGGSKLADNAGNPNIYTHYSKNNFDIFNEPDAGIYFTDKTSFPMFENAGATPRQFYLRSDNPLDVTNMTNRDIYSTEYELSPKMRDLILASYNAARNSSDIPNYEELLTYGDLGSAKANVSNLINGHLWTHRGRGTQNRLINKIFDAGYDSVIFPDYQSMRLSPDSLLTSTVVRSPSQIKSVDNIGTFDPNDPNIYRSLAPLAVGGAGAGGLLALLGAEEAQAAAPNEPASDEPDTGWPTSGQPGSGWPYHNNLGPEGEPGLQEPFFGPTDLILATAGIPGLAAKGAAAGTEAAIAAVLDRLGNRIGQSNLLEIIGMMPQYLGN